MSRPASPETQVKRLRAQNRALDKSFVSALDREKRLQAALDASHRELAEWKRRFDALLKIIPERTDG